MKKSSTAFVNRLLETTYKDSYDEFAIMSMFNYISYRLNNKTQFDIERTTEIAHTLTDIAIANTFSRNALIDLYNIFNAVADETENTDYRILYNANSIDRFTIVDETDYALYVTDSVHDICDLKSYETIF